MCVRWVVGERRVSACGTGAGTFCAAQGSLLLLRGCMDAEGALLRPRAAAWGPLGLGAVIEAAGRRRARAKERR